MGLRIILPPPSLDPPPPQTFFARAERGAGRPTFQRLPYFPEVVQHELAHYEMVVLIQAQRPVGTYAYAKACGEALGGEGGGGGGGGHCTAHRASFNDALLRSVGACAGT